MKNGRKLTACKDKQARRSPRYSTGKALDTLLANLDPGDFSPGLYGDVWRHWTSSGTSILPSIDARNYGDHTSFSRDYWLVNLFKKFEDFRGSQVVRDQAALRLYSRAQMQCFGTNCSFKSYGHLGHLIHNVTSGTILERARGIIADVLGALDGAALCTILSYMDHGPGGTTRIPRRQACPAVKFSGSPEITTRCLALLGDLLYSVAPEWLTNVTIQNHSKQSAVPKNAKTSRLISSEPDLNILVQKGIGSYLKMRLRMKATTAPPGKAREWGLPHTIDLFSQENNQRAARVSSSGQYDWATVDLSMASDTLSYEVVRYLLPDDWFSLLDHCRTADVMLIDGSISRVEMFSAMGNGFTFELQSMIFYALVRALAETRQLSSPSLVFGDDIVVSSALVEDGSLEALFSICGFNINREKTFSKGPFRESCGKHYFNGHEVTPMYISHDLSSITQLLLACNNLRRWSVAWGSRWHRDMSVIPSYRSLVSLLPKSLQKPMIADGYGDGALVGQFHEVLPDRVDRLKESTHEDRGRISFLRSQDLWYEGWDCRTTVPLFNHESYDSKGVLFASLWRLARRGLTGNRPPGRPFTGTVVLRTLLEYELRQKAEAGEPDEGAPVQEGYRWIDIVCRQFPRV